MAPTHPSPAAPMALLALGAALASAGCRVAYVTRAAWHQAGLMAKREPIDRVLDRGDLSPDQASKLALIPAIKRFGEDLGLASSDNYETISARWDRTIVNFSACEPLSLEPVGWWFPVVGSVPYLGFFRARDRERWERRYRERGYDVWVRDVAAYSTLGWFRDPVLPAMLDWEEYRLAEVVLHELTHATLWVPGSVSFNETFANVVGEQAATRWMETRHGPSSPEVHDMWITRGDHDAWRGVLEGLYQDLDEAYSNPDTDDNYKLERKQTLYSSLDQRISSAHFHRPEPYLREAREGLWNNARVAQYRTYNHSREALDTLLEQRDGDLEAFVRDVGKITANQPDPWIAVARAAALPPEDGK